MSPSGGTVALDDRQRLAWLRLFRSENIGPVTFRELVNHFGSAVAALDAVPDLAARGGRRIRICPAEEAERELAGLARIGARLVALGERDFPPLLRHVEGGPPLVAVRGATEVLVRPTVAIVGSRNASVAGRRFAAEIAHGLGSHGYVIASGLARGIDAAAHEASLGGGTVAVLAGGLDRIYPPENLDLAERIAASGSAQITEMPLGHEPRARDFPRRNRIISGMSLGVVIVEAAERSGSLITARTAAEQGRLVFSVPGSPLDPRSTGANRLIKDGAVMVTSVDDVLAEVDPMRDRGTIAPSVSEEEAPEPGPPDAAEGDREKVVAALGPTPVSIDEIIRYTGVRPQVVHLVLLELDLAGRLERHGGQRVSLT